MSLKPETIAPTVTLPRLDTLDVQHVSVRAAPLERSDTMVDDRSELAARLTSDGYVFLPGLLDRGLVLDVRGDVLDALDDQGWLGPRPDRNDAVPGPRSLSDQDDAWWPGYIAVQRLEAFHQLAHAAPILDIVSTLLGGAPVLVQPHKIARIRFPGPDQLTPPHQDFPFIQGTCDVLTAWIPLGDCPAEMGPLRVLKGSHRHGFREHAALAGGGGMGLEIDGQDPRWRSTDYRAGDVLVFSSLTIHDTAANHGDRIRLSADYRYQSALEPMNEGLVHPHAYPSVPDWDEITQAWASTEWISIPSSTPLVKARFPDADLHPGASRFTATSDADTTHTG